MTRRFYKTVTAVQDGSAFVIHLDGKPVKTPGKQTLYIPQRHMAEAVAKEWEAQVTEIKPETMPCTRLLNVAIELTPKNRERLIAEARAYAGTDLLCYRAKTPQDLAAREYEHWDPILDWARQLGIDLNTTTSALALPQSEESLLKVAELARDMDDVTLTLLLHYTAVFGSAVLALAVIYGRLHPAQAYDLSRLDADYQNDIWGRDEEDHVRISQLRAEVESLSQLLPLVLHTETSS